MQGLEIKSIEIIRKIEDDIKLTKVLQENDEE